MDQAAEQSAPTTGTASDRAREMLLEFLHERDAECTLCGYNLRALVRPICPECGQELVLTVGAARVRLGWLMAAVAPGFFSGIAATFVLIPIVGQSVFGDHRINLTIIGTDLFGWCSLAFAISLILRRHRFLALPRGAQRWYVLGIWTAHVMALGVVILVGPRFL
jgi:predicted RNA-binding Zn-ribbon protein involved in translation (DUF1610 family)